jgi:hypothetical protein
VQDDDVVRVDDGAQPVRDDDARRRRAREVTLDHRLAEVVERARRLVEQEHRRHRGGDRALSLDACVHAARHRPSPQHRALLSGQRATAETT